MLDYIRITADIFIALRGHDKTMHVLMTLLFNRNIHTNHTRFMAISEIADFSGVSTRHTYRIIESLKENNYIEEVENRKGEYMFYLNILEHKPELTTDAETTDAVEDDLEEMLKSTIANNKKKEGSQ